MAVPVHMLTTVAWRNMWRNHRRTLIMVAAVAVGVWAMIWMTAIMRGMVDQMIRSSIQNLTGHIQIHAPRYRDDPSIANSMKAPSPALLKALDDPRIRAWAERVRVPAVIQSERDSAGVTLVGIDPRQEKNLSFIDHSISAGRNLTGPDDNGIIIGRRLAKTLETRLGHRVVIMSQDPQNHIVDRGFRIVGIFSTEFESTEKAYVFTGRRAAQKFLHADGDTQEISVLAGNYRGLDPLLEKLRAAAPKLEIMPWDQLDPYLGSMLKVMDAFIWIWFVVIFLAMSFGLVNTLLMAVFERTREIGLVQALGMRPRHIIVQVLIESLFMLAIGLVIGNMLAWLTLLPIKDGWDISALGTEGLEMFQISRILYPVVELRDVVASNAVVIVLGLLASLYPAWRASRFVPVQAIVRN
jgi:ABC-type lipoprotein release transport system permease subunit